MSPLPPSPSTPDSEVVLSEISAVPALLVLRRWTRSFSARFGWGLYTLLCFGIFLFLTFPVDILLQRVIASATRGTPLHVRYAQGELNWHGAGVVHDMTIKRTDANLPPFKLNRLTVQPSWLGLLFGHPLPLSFQADVYGGTISGTVEQSTEGLRTNLVVQRVDLALFPLPSSGKPERLKGFLTGSGDVRGDLSQVLSLKGTLNLDLSEGALQAGALGKVPIPPFQSFRGQLRTVLRDGRLNISDLVLTGDGIEARMQGALTLSTPLPRSGLDLQLTTKTTGSPPPPLVALLSLLPVSPNTPGERHATIRGSLAAPVMR